MAKKRKLRSSDPEPAKTVDPQQEQELQQQQPNPEELTLDQQQQQMAIDDPAPLQNDVVEEQQDEVEEEEEEEEAEEDENDEGEQQQQQQQQQQPQDQEEEEQQHEQGKTLENQDNQLPEQGSGSDTVQNEANGAQHVEEENLDLEDEPVEKLLEPFTKEQLLSLVKQAVEKHPDLADNVRQLADVDPAHRKIFVHGLGWDATAETLTAVFGKYGEIEDCKAVTDKLSGKSKGYAFILFKHRAGARRALKQPQKKIGNRTTSCQLASAGPVPAPPPTAPSAVVSEYTQRKIFVSNVSADIDPQQLLEFFKQFGEVEDGPLGLDKMTGKPKGFALFVYKTVESAKKALEEPHKNFEGHTLYCQKAVDGPKGNKGYYQHHQQHHQHHSHHHHQSHYHRKDKNKYTPAGPAHGGGGHLMAPSAASPAVGGYNPGVPPQAAQGLNPALGQALTALLANQGAAGLGLGNLLGGLGGAPVNQPGPPAGAYGNQPAMGYGNQAGMQPGYQNPQMGQSSGVRPHPGAGAPYMGH